MAALAAVEDRSAFVPVAVSAPAAERSSSELGRGTMTIAFGENVRLTIEGAPDDATLSRVIGALAGHDRRRWLLSRAAFGFGWRLATPI
jgi:hypothetical protein